MSPLPHDCKKIHEKTSGIELHLKSPWSLPRPFAAACDYLPAPLCPKHRSESFKIGVYYLTLLLLCSKAFPWLSFPSHRSHASNGATSPKVRPPRAIPPPPAQPSRPPCLLTIHISGHMQRLISACCHLPDAHSCAMSGFP